jgi:hypothetical protein
MVRHNKIAFENKVNLMANYGTQVSGCLVTDVIKKVGQVSSGVLIKVKHELK